MFHVGPIFGEWSVHIKPIVQESSFPVRPRGTAPTACALRLLPCRYKLIKEWCDSALHLICCCCLICCVSRHNESRVGFFAPAFLSLGGGLLGGYQSGSDSSNPPSKHLCFSLARHKVPQIMKTAGWPFKPPGIWHGNRGNKAARMYAPKASCAHRMLPVLHLFQHFPQHGSKPYLNKYVTQSPDSEARAKKTS